MEKNIEKDRYESLQKSVNNAIKLLCTKIQDLKVEVKELRGDKDTHVKNHSDLCSCIKSNEYMRNKMDRIEEKMEKIIKENNPTTVASYIKETIDGNIGSIEMIESEISALKKKQAENCENISLINESIMSLQKSHDALMKSEENTRVLMMKHMDELKEAVRKKEINSTVKTFDDSESETKFASKECLSKHIKYKHSIRKIFTCEICNHDLKESIDLEKHMITVHNTEKQYKCDICESAFVVEWHLRKHKINHQKNNVRKCHYFNNMKPCPFWTLGCKFSHEVSNMCKFNQSCRLKKCQFRHSQETKNSSN